LRESQFLEQRREARLTAKGIEHAILVRQQLDRDVTIESRIASAIHDAHAALADAVEDFVWAEVRAGVERQARVILS
jgi:hypothetical protein